MNSRVKKHIWDVFSNIALIIVAIMCIFPFYFLFINATHSNADIINRVLTLPGNRTFENINRLLQWISPMQMMRNSLIISLPATFLAGYVGSLTAYGFSKFQFPAKKFLFWFVLATMMIPLQINLIGLAQISRSLGILGSYWPVILPNMAHAATVFWLTGHFSGAVNISIIESARVEGCSELRIFHALGLPLAKAGIATISIFNFVSVWNNYLTPLALLSSRSKFPLSIGIAIIRTVDPRDLGSLYSGIAISVIPILVVFMFLSRFIMGGLTSGAVKG